MTDDFSFLPELPTLDDSPSKVYSFMFYDLERYLSPQWIELIEGYFSFYGYIPDELVLHENDDIQGTYERKKDRLVSALEAASQGAAIDFRVRSELVEDGEGFYPSDVSVSVNTSGPGMAQGVFSVRMRSGTHWDATPTLIAERVLSVGGNFYGHASIFPAILGPDSYAASVGSIPKGWSFMSTRAYTRRVTAWRDHSKKRNNLNGFFREVFPYNFLTDAHLANRILDKSASEFFEQFGNLKPLGLSNCQYIWTVPVENIADARTMLERANLILSAR